MSKLAVPAVFIFYRDALDTYARLTATPAEAALRVLQILLATLSALPHEASHTEDQRPCACILRPSARLSRRCPRPYCVLDIGFREDPLRNCPKSPHGLRTVKPHKSTKRGDEALFRCSGSQKGGSGGCSRPFSDGLYWRVSE